MKYLMHQPKAQLSKAVKKSNTIYKLFKIENKNLDNLLTWAILLDFDWLTWAR